MQKLLIKFWDTLIDKGVGKLIKPWQMKREGKVNLELRRAEMLVIAQTEEDIRRIKAGEMKLLPDGTLAEVRQEKLISTAESTITPKALLSGAIEESLKEDLQRDINLNKTLIYAEEELSKGSSEPNNEQISDEWFEKWRKAAQETSSEQMQRIWARVLAGEITNTGTFSLRAIEFLRSISFAEAQDIEKLAQFTIAGMVVKDDAILDKHGINIQFRLMMEDLGILNGTTSLGLTMTLSSHTAGSYIRGLVSRTRVVVARHTDPNKKITLLCEKISRLGIEILQLVDAAPNEEYLSMVAKKIKGQGFNVTLADVTSQVGDQIYFGNEVPI